jgi:hypothetical protein
LGSEVWQTTTRSSRFKSGWPPCYRPLPAPPSGRFSPQRLNPPRSRHRAGRLSTGSVLAYTGR